MLRIIQITDLHWYAEPHRLMRGADVDANVTAVLSHIRQHHGLPEALLVTGDLVHDETAAYERLQGVLQDFGVPAYCLPGNHDEPHTMHAQLRTGPLQWCREILLGGWQILMLNSYVPDSAGGHLADTELEVLEQHLAVDPTRPALVAVHHHPIPAGIDWMDALMLDNAEALFAVLDRYPQVRGLIWGHAHQAMTGQRGAIKLLGTPATSFQFQADPETADLELTWPGYRWLHLSQDGQLHSGVEWVPPLSAAQAVAPVQD